MNHKIAINPSLPADEPMLANLVELYIHDFSAFLPIEVGEDGRFGYPPLPLYWSDPNRFPFHFTVDGHLFGFALIRKGSQISGDENTWDMAEFFILCKYRRMGLGQLAAQEIWKKFPGLWEVRVIDRNPLAGAFWANTVAITVGKSVFPKSYQIKEEGWRVFRFETSQ